MYYECCVQNCLSTKLDAKLYKFPSIEYRRIRWLQALNNTNTKSLKAVKNLFICQLHFEKRFFGSKLRLLSQARPTLFTTDEIASGIASGIPNKVKANVIPQIDYFGRHYDHNYSKNLIKSGLKQQLEKDLFQPDESANDACTTDLNEIMKEAPFELQRVSVDVSAIKEEWDEPCPWQQDSAAGFGDVADADVPMWEVPLRSQSIQSNVNHPPNPGTVPNSSTYDHNVYRCDECLQDIQQCFRYTCVQCAGVELCVACEARQAHATHYVLRVPPTRPHSEVTSVLQSLRRALSDVIEYAHHLQSPKVEIKEEIQEDSIHVATEDEIQLNKEENHRIKNELFVENLESSNVNNETENGGMFVENFAKSHVENNCLVASEADTQPRHVHRDIDKHAHHHLPSLIPYLDKPTTTIRQSPTLKPVKDKKLVILQRVGRKYRNKSKRVVQIEPIKHIQTITNKENRNELLKRLFKPSGNQKLNSKCFKRLISDHLLHQRQLKRPNVGKIPESSKTSLVFANKKITVLGPVRKVYKAKRPQVPTGTKPIKKELSQSNRDIEMIDRLISSTSPRDTKMKVKLKKQLCSSARVCLHRLNSSDIQAAIQHSRSDNTS